MKTKYPLPYKIKGFVEWLLEHYHEEKKQLEQYRNDLIPSGIAQYERTPVKSGPSDTTASVGIALATNPYILSIERNIKAVEYALSKCDETDIKLIELIYWRRSHTVNGAAMKVNLTKSPAYGRINRVLNLIALELGLINL